MEVTSAGLLRKRQVLLHRNLERAGDIGEERHEEGSPLSVGYGLTLLLR